LAASRRPLAELEQVLRQAVRGYQTEMRQLSTGLMQR